MHNSSMVVQCTLVLNANDFCCNDAIKHCNLVIFTRLDRKERELRTARGWE